MKKKYALITDIHGNIEAFNAILNDIKSKDYLNVHLYYKNITNPNIYVLIQQIQN